MSEVVTQHAPDTSKTGRHFPELDGFRGVAVLMVLFLHLIPAMPHPTGSPLYRAVCIAISSGWVGVDLFFALSGFLITGILYDTQSSTRFFRNFYARRALRIFPLYYGFLFLIIAVSAALGYHWYGTTFYYLLYLQSLVHPMPRVTNAPWVTLSHFWTLAIEEQFYFVWPALLYFLRTKRRILGAAAALAGASMALRVYLELTGVSAARPFFTYEWTLSRVDTLLMGAILAIAVRTRYRNRILAAAPAAACVGLLTLAGYAAWKGAFYFMDDPVVRLVGVPLLGLTSCAVIAAALHGSKPFRAVLGTSFLRFFGRYSYGLYIIHYTVFFLMETYVEPRLLAHVHARSLLLPLTAALTLGVTVVLTLMSFHFFEQPVLALKRHFQDDSKTPKLRRQLQELA